MRAFVTVSVTLLLLTTALVPAGAQDPDGRYRDFGDPGGFHNIVPPGQDGVVNGPEALAAQGGEFPPHYQDQLSLYDGLILEDATPGFATEDLATYFKDASFGVPDDDIARTYSPGGRDDVTVLRDGEFGIPHIYGDTRAGAMFARGYTAAEDRLFLMDVLRHVGRAELSAFIGASDANRAQDASQMAAAPYLEEDLTEQVEAFRQSADPVLNRVAADAESYIAGVNQYVSEALTDPTKLPAEYPALQKVPEEFVLEDIIAIAALVGGIFGKGGGREVQNFCGLEQLGEEVGAGDARRIFDDLKLADDPEAPATAHGAAFPYLQDLGPIDPAAVPDLDCDSLQAIQAPQPEDPALVGEAVEDLVPTPPAPAPGAAPASGSLTIDLPWGTRRFDLSQTGLSNALLVGGDRTDTGNPLAVFGPQTGYFVPQLLSEFDIHAPGIDARGVSFAGTDLYVQLGRGRDYAWSATSAGGDLVDEAVLELCEPGGGEPTVESMGFVDDGECRDVEPKQDLLIAQPTAAGDPTGASGQEPQQPEQEDILINKYFEVAPGIGFLTARGSLEDGTPIAVVNRRTTYEQELTSARGFAQINDPGFVTGVDSFRRAFGQGVDYTFNWFYVDGEDIGYQVSCLCPQRAEGVDPYLPAWAGRDFDYRGFVEFEGLPHSVNPDEGYLISWNNKQARQWRSNDGQFGWGPIHRSSLLERRLNRALADGPIDVGTAVDVMALAGTTDLRAQELVSLLADVMRGREPADLDDRTRSMFQRLRDWADDDLGHRRDHDGDGAYEHATAIAVMDAWWGGLPGADDHGDAKLFDAVFAAGTADARTKLGLGVHDAPQNHLGSAFQDSLYAHVHKDLRQVLGRPVSNPFSQTYCGGGDVEACAADLWASLAAAGTALEDEFGSGDPASWQRVPADDAIKHSAVGIAPVRDIDWQNRPTFQQVVQVPAGPAPAPGGAGDETDSTEGAPLPATGGGGLALVLGVGLLGLAGALRRGRDGGSQRAAT